MDNSRSNTDWGSSDMSGNSGNISTGILVVVNKVAVEVVLVAIVEVIMIPVVVVEIFARLCLK